MLLSSSKDETTVDQENVPKQQCLPDNPYLQSLSKDPFLGDNHYPGENGYPSEYPYPANNPHPANNTYPVDNPYLANNSACLATDAQDILTETFNHGEMRNPYPPQQPDNPYPQQCLPGNPYLPQSQTNNPLPANQTLLSNNPYPDTNLNLFCNPFPDYLLEDLTLYM